MALVPRDPAGSKAASCTCCRDALGQPVNMELRSSNINNRLSGFQNANAGSTPGCWRTLSVQHSFQKKNCSCVPCLLLGFQLNILPACSSTGDREGRAGAPATPPRPPAGQAAERPLRARRALLLPPQLPVPTALLLLQSMLPPPLNTHQHRCA